MADLKDIVAQGKLGLNALKLFGPQSDQSTRIFDLVEDAIDAIAIGGNALEAFAANSGEAAAEVDRVIAAGGATREDFETNTRSIDEITARLIARQEAAKQG